MYNGHPSFHHWAAFMVVSNTEHIYLSALRNDFEDFLFTRCKQTYTREQWEYAYNTVRESA